MAAKPKRKTVSKKTSASSSSSITTKPVTSHVKTLKKKAKLSARQRQQQITNELQDAQAEREAHRNIAAQAEADQLFCLDTTGDSTIPRPRATVRPKKTKQILSRQDTNHVEKLLQRHTPEELRALATKSAPVPLDGVSFFRRKTLKAKYIDNFDLWNDTSNKQLRRLVDPQHSDTRASSFAAVLAPAEPLVAGISSRHVPVRALSLTAARAAQPLSPPNATSTISSSTVLSSLSPPAVAVEVAQPGQSYHPDRRQHQRVIDRAVRIELRREAARQQRTQPLSTGMTPATRAVLVHDSDSEESDDEEETAIQTDVTLPAKRREKLTRAQRNKQKRVRLEQQEIISRKRMKQRNHQLHLVSCFQKEITKQEVVSQAKRQQRQTDRRLRFQQPRGVALEEGVAKVNPLQTPTVPVTLDINDEPNTNASSASLRTLRPKGSLVRERLLSWRDRGHGHLAKTVVTGRRQDFKKKKVIYKGKRNSQWKGDTFIIERR